MISLSNHLHSLPLFSFQMALSNLCRSLSIKFYASNAQGFGGWIFSDLGSSHEYICEYTVTPSDTTTSTDGKPNNNNQPTKKRVKKSQEFVTLERALSHGWKGEKRNKLKRMRLSPGFFATLGEYKTYNHSIVRPDMALLCLTVFSFPSLPFFSFLGM